MWSIRNTPGCEEGRRGCIENVYRNTMTNGERERDYSTVPPKGMYECMYVPVHREKFQDDRPEVSIYLAHEPCALRRSRAHSTKSSNVDGHAATGWERGFRYCEKHGQGRSARTVEQNGGTYLPCRTSRTLHLSSARTRGTMNTHIPDF
jgi:hypothetical protein